MPTEVSNVVVMDIKMPFSSMVVFMVKWAIATIPAIIIKFTVGRFSLLFKSQSNRESKITKVYHIRDDCFEKGCLGN